MKPCGIIATYMSRQDWQGKNFLPKVGAIFFNCKLFVGQLFFLIAGTAYGKFKWPKAPLWFRIVCTVGMGAAMAGMVTAIMEGTWPLVPVNIISLVLLVATYRGIDWIKIWQAAQVSHVRLCLQPTIRGHWEYINFGADRAKIEVWRMGQIIDNKRFRYFDPTFPTPPEFMEPVIQYAEDQVGKKYDELQLISSGLHLIAWIVWPWSWGKELKIIKALNRPGGLEDCISGVTACLRWGETRYKFEPVNTKLIASNYYRLKTDFFPGYSTATTFPCLVPLSENWREVKK